MGGQLHTNKYGDLGSLTAIKRAKLQRSRPLEPDLACAGASVAERAPDRAVWARSVSGSAA